MVMLVYRPYNGLDQSLGTIQHIDNLDLSFIMTMGLFTSFIDMMVNTKHDGTNSLEVIFTF